MTTTVTFDTTTNDLYGRDLSSLIVSASAALNFGTDGTPNNRTRVWIPFTSVPLPKNLSIISATLKMWSDQSFGTVGQHLACEAQDNPSAPTTWADLSTRVQTTAKLTIASMPMYAGDTEITFDLTTSVQEILNRAGWVYGNTLAILSVDDGNTNASAVRRFYSFDDVNFLMPKLEIVFDNFVPRSGMV